MVMVSTHLSPSHVEADLLLSGGVARAISGGVARAISGGVARASSFKY